MSLSRAGAGQLAVSLLFFLSGASGLVYEIVWSRQLQLLFGVSTFAITTVVAAYMAGLALGSGLFGRIADRLTPDRAIVGYGILELALGGFALLFPVLLSGVSAAYRALVPEAPGVRVALQFALSFGMLLIPTILMGGTLPLVSRFLVATSGKTTRGFGWAYALNTLGAVAGVLLAGFVLLEHLGARRSLLLFGAVNVGVGIAALIVGRLAKGSFEHEESEESAIRPRHRVRLLAAAAFSGLVALGCEIAWVRGFVTLMVSTTYTFSLVLATYLVGIALGSAVAARLVPTERKVTVVFSLLGVTALAQVLLFGFCHATMYETASAPDATFSSLLGTQAFLVALVVLPLTLCSGAALPLLVGLSSRGLGSTGRDVAAVYIANTVGAVTGAVAVGFLLLPACGPFTTCRLLAGVAILGLLLVAGPRPLAIAGAALIAACALLPPPSVKMQSLSPVLLGSRIRKAMPGSFEESMVSEVIARAHGTSADVAVTVSARDGHRGLVINGMPNASTYGDTVTQIGLAVLPYLFAPRVRDCVHVGLGSGVTPGAWAALPGTQHTTVIELEGAIWDAAREFAPYHFGLHDRDNVRFVTDDGRSHLVLAPEASYDVIISEPSQIWSKGVGNLFTTECFRSAKRALREDGVFATWIMSYSVPDHVWAIAVATLIDEFAHVQCFANPDYPGDAFFLCSSSPLELQRDRWRNLHEVTGPAAMMKVALELDEPDALAVYWVADRAGLAAQVFPTLRQHGMEDVRNTDDHPVLEHLYPKSFLDSRNVGLLEILMRARRVGGRFRMPPGVTRTPRPEIVWRLCQQSRVDPAPLLLGTADVANLAEEELGTKRGWAFAAALVRGDIETADRLAKGLTKEHYREASVVMAAAKLAESRRKTLPAEVLEQIGAPNDRTPHFVTVAMLQGWFAHWRATRDAKVAARYVETFLAGFSEERILVHNPPVETFLWLAEAARGAGRVDDVERYARALLKKFGWHYVPAALLLGRLLADTGRPDEARELVAKFDGWSYRWNSFLDRLRSDLR